MAHSDQNISQSECSYIFLQWYNCWLMSAGVWWAIIKPGLPCYTGKVTEGIETIWSWSHWQKSQTTTKKGAQENVTFRKSIYCRYAMMLWPNKVKVWIISCLHTVIYCQVSVIAPMPLLLMWCMRKLYLLYPDSVFLCWHLTHLSDFFPEYSYTPPWQIHLLSSIHHGGSSLENLLQG